MEMKKKDIKTIFDELIIQPKETEWLEYKEAKTNYDFNKLGNYFSALSNEANLKNQPCGWMIFGVNNNRKIIGTNFRSNRSKLDSLKSEIAEHTTGKITFVEIFELYISKKRLIVFQIPAAPKGIPIAWKGHYYGRNDEQIGALNIQEIEQIRNQVNQYDWSAQTCDGATLKDLDPVVRYFPLPDYDLTQSDRVIVKLQGKILDENYTRILIENTNLDLGIVILLDKVQKQKKITKDGHKLLRSKKLVEGRYPNLYVSSQIASVTRERAKYIKQRGFDKQYYQDLVTAFIKNNGSATRQDIDDLISNKLPDIFTNEQKKRKINNLLTELSSKSRVLKNIGTKKHSKWILINK